MIETLLDLGLLLIASLFMHELGHYLYIKNNITPDTYIRFGKNSKDKFELYTALDKTTYNNTTQEHRNYLHFYGILFGSFPLILYLVFVNNIDQLVVWVGMSTIYVLSCRSDILSIKNWTGE